MKIAILGTGHMGRTIGGALVAAGHDVVYGSRAPHTSGDLPAPVTPHREAIAHGRLVVNALAAAHSLETLTPLRADLAGRTMIDIGNAVDERLELLYPDGSLGERLQQALPETRVVKSLSSVGGLIGVNPTALPAPSTVFVSGDDADAKAEVAQLLGDLGWGETQRIDLGGIATARAVEHYFLLFAALMGALRTPDFNIAVVR